MIAVLIPAYEPDRLLVDLVESIRRRDPDQHVVIVDDGSGPGYGPVFDAARRLGCDVVTHDHNRGKGAALKSGFAHVAHHHPSHDVVCADCDGQHAPGDIAKVATLLRAHRAGIALGAREFAGDVPLRSRFGNTVTRGVFRFATGLTVHDTQTGLRGYPAWMLVWLQTIDGDRFEYELEVLLAAQRIGIELHEVPIETIYLNGNESSHFRTVRDSVRVYVPFLKFSMSSLAAFAIDASVFFAMMWATDRLAISVVSARIVSATCNYVANHRLVFGSRRSHRSAATRYAGLVGAVMAANYVLLRVLTGPAGLSLVPAKFLTELVLFVAGYRVQRRSVFAVEPIVEPDEAEEPELVPASPEGAAA